MLKNTRGGGGVLETLTTKQISAPSARAGVCDV